MSEKMREIILNHLMNRPIASIVVNSLEKNFDIALKVMCVLDYYVEKENLYADIKAIPKLLEQIMRFRYFGSFKYYEYKLKKSLLMLRVLQCESCEFIGPYKTTLEHMVMTHDRHKSGLICQYCNKTQLRNHERCHTLENCFMTYKIRKQINSNYEWPPVICEFYELVRKIAVKLGVNIQRTEGYKGSDNRKDNAVIEIDSDDDDTNEIKSDEYVHRSTSFSTKKSINLRVLDGMFQEAMHYFNVPIENFCPLIDPSNQIIESIQTISTNLDHNTASQYYCDNPSAQYRFYSTTTVPATMHPGPSFDMQTQFAPVMAPSIAVYTPLTPPITMNDNLSPPNGQSSTNNINEPNEMTKFANFIASTLNNMNTESIKRKAKFQIHQLILQLSAEDMNLTFQANNKM